MTAQPEARGTYGHAIIAGHTADLSREDWVAGRSRYLGASEVAAILCLMDSEPGREEDDYGAPPESLNAYRGPWDVWAVKTGRKPPFAGNASTAVGNLVEPHIRRWASEALGGEVATVPYLLQHPEAPRMVTNLDGWLTTEGVPVELKWCSWRGRNQWQAWSEYVAAGHPTSEPPMVCQGQSLMGYWFQVQAQLAVTGAPYGYLCAISGESALHVIAGHPPAPGDAFVFRVEPDADFLRVLPAEVERWWAAHIEADVAPEPTLADYEAIREAYRQEVAGKVIDAPELLPHVEAYKAAAAEAKAAKAAQDKAKLAIVAALGDAERAKVPGHKDVTWKRNKNGVRTLRIG